MTGSARPAGLALAALLAASFASRAARAEEPMPRLRFGFSGSIGYTRTVVDKLSLGQDERSIAIGTSFGPGLDVRVGVRLHEVLALDLQAFTETLAVMLGQGRVAALVDLAPVRSFSIAGGIGYGEVYSLNVLTGFETANYWVGILRPELHFPERTRDYEWTVGIEACLGESTGGTTGSGHQVFGGRLVFGMLTR